MLHVGLTGGIGSGKSTVARALVDRGAHLLDADQLARELLAPDSAVLDEVAAAFGGDILDTQGRLDRRALADRVFTDPERREVLDRILHPRINALERERAAAIGARFPKAVVVYEAPLLVESGAHRAVDRVAVVDVTPERQWQRAIERGDRPEEQIRAIMEAQCSREKRLRFADDVLDNDGPWQETERQLDVLMEEYRDLARGPHGTGA